MPKGYFAPKTFNCVGVSNRLNLLFLQTFTIAVYNARLKLKEYKFRYSDVSTILIVGELNSTGCKIIDYKNLTSSDYSVCRNILKRAEQRGIVYSHCGKKGRGYATNFYLTDKGHFVFSVLQKEMGKTMKEAKSLFLIDLKKSL